MQDEATHFPNGHDQKFVSRYLDESNLPQFPFGFGLTYSTLRYGPAELNKPELRLDWLREGLKNPSSSAPAPLLASANITNTGSRTVTETVQLTCVSKVQAFPNPYARLKVFSM